MRGRCGRRCAAKTWSGKGDHPPEPPARLGGATARENVVRGTVTGGSLMAKLTIKTLAGDDAPLGEEVVEAFGKRLRGGLLRPGDGGYDAARAVWNGMTDKRPGLIARCAGVADVISAGPAGDGPGHVARNLAWATARLMGRAGGCPGADRLNGWGHRSDRRMTAIRPGQRFRTAASVTAPRRSRARHLRGDGRE